jgi:hypothetical protein
MLANNKPGATFGQAAGAGLLGGLGTYSQFQRAAALNKLYGAQFDKAEMENQFTKKRLGLLDKISTMDAPGGMRGSVNASAPYGSSGSTFTADPETPDAELRPVGGGVGKMGGGTPSNPFLAELDRKYAIARMYESIDPKASAELFKEAAAQDPRLKLQNTAAGNMMVQGADGSWSYAPGLVQAEAGKAGTVAGATERAKLPYDFARREFDTNQAIRQAWAVPQQLAPGAQIADLSGARGGASGAPGNIGIGANGQLTVPQAPGGARVVATSPFPAPGTQEGKFRTNFADLQTAAIGTWHSDAVSAANQNRTLDQMEAQLKEGLQTGTGFDTRLFASNLLTTLGADPSKIAGLPDPTQGAIFDRGVKEMLIERARAFGANPSNAEGQRIEKSILSANDPTQATQALIDWMRQRNGLKIQKAQEGMAYTFGPNGEIKGDPLSFDLDWAKKYGSGTPAAPQSNGGGEGGKLKPLDATTRSEAQNAIMKGAKREAVIERLKKNGYDVSKF